MKKLIFTVACASALSLSGCSSLNPFSSSDSNGAPLAAIEPTAQLQTIWQAHVGDSGPYVFQPAIADGAIYAAAHDGTVARYENGRAAWSVKADKRLSAGVGSNGRLVVVVTSGGDVIALDAATGGERWRASAGAEVLAPPAIGDSIVVVRASDSRLMGFDANSGARRWVFQRPVPPLALRSYAGMTVEGNVAIVGYPGGKLVAINLGNGGQLWELTVATPRGATELERVADIAGTPVLGRREICAVAYQGRAACFDAANGNALWSREFSSSVGMDRDGRFVFVTDDADAVHALDASTGASVWKQGALARRGLTRPVVVDGFVAVGDAEGYVHLLNRETGAFTARTRAGKSPMVADPLRFGSQGFVVQNRDGDIHVFEAR